MLNRSTPRRRSKKKENITTNEGWGRRTGSPPARAGYAAAKRKERSEETQEFGWEDGTPHPHRELTPPLAAVVLNDVFYFGGAERVAYE